MNTEPTQLTLPPFHLNGNSVPALTKEYTEAYNKLREFVDTFSAIEFHPRDYYPLGDDAWNKAQTQRDEARRNINEVYKYLEAHVEHCYNHAN